MTQEKNSLGKDFGFSMSSHKTMQESMSLGAWD
jgi:hypothetical protein